MLPGSAGAPSWHKHRYPTIRSFIFNRIPGPSPWRTRGIRRDRRRGADACPLREGHRRRPHERRRQPGVAAAAATAACNCAGESVIALPNPATSRADVGSKATIEKSPSPNHSAAWGNRPR